jgi:NAD(P)-dependent dehydrogenase (short-subunit alcohol dehydrogenase family)
MAKKEWLITVPSHGIARHWAQVALQRGDRGAATARDTNSLLGLVETYGDTVPQAHQAFARLDVVVNKAGCGLAGAVEEVSDEQVRAQLETNFSSPLWITQAVPPIWMRSPRRSMFPIPPPQCPSVVCASCVFPLHESKHWQPKSVPFWTNSANRFPIPKERSMVCARRCLLRQPISAS